MSSIRPLITITILAVVGAILYVKINEGPVRHGALTADVQQQTPDGVPPLATTGAPSPTANTPAPQWPAAATSTTPPPATTIPTGQTASTSSPRTNPLSSATASNTPSEPGTNPGTLPEVPSIPELPELPMPADNPGVPPTQIAPATIPPGLPGNIPTARYPDQPSSPLASNTQSSPPDFAGTVSPLGATPGNITPTSPAGSSPDRYGSAPAATLNADDSRSASLENEHSSAADSAIAAVGLGPRPGDAAGSTNGSPSPLSSTPPAANGADRYSSPPASANDRTAAGASIPVPTSFAASWPEVQAAIDHHELARAHQLLSTWYGNPSLTPAESAKVESLLSQLAGTVIYSTEPALGPPYVVKPGETLETIAKDQQVPWQLLAKINGIAAADQVRPGQELKVVRGPFSAVVDVGKNQLTLTLDGRYAGKFPISIPAAGALNDGEWVVDQKLVMPSTSVAQSAYAPASGSVDRAIVLRDQGPTGSAAAGLGRTLTIASASSPSGPTASSPAIRVSPQDAEELSDILSVGSRIVIRR